MPKKYDIAIVGATGIVGGAMLEILAERTFPVGTVYALASERSIGKEVDFGKRSLAVDNLADFDFSNVQIGLFSAGSSISAEFAPQAAAQIQLGGISSGQDILASIALKPTSSVSVPGKTIDKKGDETEIVTKGRHDPCVGLRATPIAEAMVALVLMDHYMRHRAQNADVNLNL